MQIRIKSKIYWSFSVLVLLFVINGVITITTLNSNRKLAAHLNGVVDPSLQAIEDFQNMLVKSKLYTTNWVFLRFNQEDKASLKNLHDSAYYSLKSRLDNLAQQWENRNWIDSLHKVYAGFNQLLAVEKDIMGTLKEFKDYDDPVLKLEAEEKIEEEILPRTTELISALDNLHTLIKNVQVQENDTLDHSSVKLRSFIIILAITIIFTGLFFSIYMSGIIISPINKIRAIINDLGKGIIDGRP